MERRAFNRTLVFSSGFILINPSSLISANLDKKAIKISMIYNNIGSNIKLKSAWGLSIWIETEETSLLFDTGGDSSVLRKNINSLNFDISKLSSIFISHKHWDHLNGLNAILEKTSNSPNIYIVESDYTLVKEKFPKAKIINIKEPKQIDKNIWTTGELKGIHRDDEIFEHSLIFTQNDSIILLTGCSHSGIVEMVEKTRQIFPHKKIELVAGGFHLGKKSKEEIIKISANLKELNVQKIAPSHCTGDGALEYFKKDWTDNFIDLNLGDNFMV
jgi:7,8-dihydropterin-6-yl-methyl-4-(beta-D-ribofuranosyl)aminobenzene 5'-phosphate synthase